MQAGVPLGFIPVLNEGGRTAVEEHITPARIIGRGNHRIDKVIAAGIHEGTEEESSAGNTRIDMASGENIVFQMLPDSGFFILIRNPCNKSHGLIGLASAHIGTFSRIKPFCISGLADLLGTGAVSLSLFGMAQNIANRGGQIQNVDPVAIIEALIFLLCTAAGRSGRKPIAQLIPEFAPGDNEIILGIGLEEAEPFLHLRIAITQDALVSVLEINFPGHTDNETAPGGTAAADIGGSGVEQASVFGLDTAPVISPLVVEGRQVMVADGHIDRRVAIAAIAEAFALRTIDDETAQGQTVKGPEGRVVNAVEEFVIAVEFTDAFVTGRDDLADDFFRIRQFIHASDIDPTAGIVIEMVGKGPLACRAHDVGRAHTETDALIGSFGPGHLDFGAGGGFERDLRPAAEILAHIDLDDAVIQALYTDSMESRLHENIAFQFFGRNVHVLGFINRGRFPGTVIELRSIPAGDFLICIIEIAAELMPDPFAQEVTRAGMGFPGRISDPTGRLPFIEGNISLSHDNGCAGTLGNVKLRESDPADSQPEGNRVFAFFQVRGDIIGFIADLVFLEV